jgi:hypothetical protein
MRFTLTYEGLLPPSANDARVAEKHDIRKSFHPQLWEMWNSHIAVDGWTKDWLRAEAEIGLPDEKKKSLLTVFPLRDFKFVPLVTRRLFLTCQLNITILRHQPPGRNMDLDNRLLTLFDALRKPHFEQELPPLAKPDVHETPFCCLLEDDSLITDYNIHTDTLLKSTTPSGPEYIVLLIEAVIKTRRLLFGTIPLLGD